MYAQNNNKISQIIQKKKRDLRSQLLLFDYYTCTDELAKLMRPHSVPLADMLDDIQFTDVAVVNMGMSSLFQTNSLGNLLLFSVEGSKC
jgi:hypothetical protein